MSFHLPARNDGGMDPAPARYTIRIRGHLGATVLSAFPALAPLRHGADTVLTGMLAEVDALGLELLEVRQLAPQRGSPGSAERRSPTGC